MEWPKVNEKAVQPSAWLNANRAVQQMVWHPGKPALIHDEVQQVAGWVSHPGATVFNLYRPPNPPGGDANQAGQWLEHVRRVFPDDASHIVQWLAQRVQRPGVKVNHALVLGGPQGVGKDTIPNRSRQQ